MTVLYLAYLSLTQRWFMEWERGGMVPPGGYEACLDGRCAECQKRASIGSTETQYSVKRELV